MPPCTDETETLQAAIAARVPGPAILIWIRHRPRVTTLRPVAETLAARGYGVFVAYSDTLDADPDAMGFAPDMPCFQLPRHRVAELEDIAVCITSEQDTGDAPWTAQRVGIHHSLPDHNLKRNYAKVLAILPVGVRNTDYYAILSRQDDANWTVENYAPHVDRQLPRQMIAGRRPSMAIVPFGYPKIDQMIARDTRGDRLDTITYAPTQSFLSWGSVLDRGADIIAALLDGFPDHRVAFRPYPGDDVERTRHVYERFLDDPRFSLDDSPTGEALLRRTAVMVSDQSSVAISFGLGFARPVIFYKTKPKGRLMRDGMDYFHPIGWRVTSIDALRQCVRQVLANAGQIRERIERRRGDYIYNPGRSAEYLADAMPDILAGTTRPEWLEVPRRPFRAWTWAAYRRQYDHVIGKVAAGHKHGVEAAERALRSGFAPLPERLFRTVARRTLRRMPGLRRYLPRPRDRS